MSAEEIALSHHEAVDWIMEQGGLEFDPEAVEAFRARQAVRMSSDAR